MVAVLPVTRKQNAFQIYRSVETGIPIFGVSLVEYTGATTLRAYRQLFKDGKVTRSELSGRIGDKFLFKLVICREEELRVALSRADSHIFLLKFSVL